MPEEDVMEFSDPPEEQESEIDEIPKDLRALRTQAYDKSISDLVEMIKNGDIILNPEYQRDYVWDDTKASLLIESILLNVPIPVVYVAEDEDGCWNVVDGLQRLSSIARFMNNEFALRGLEVLSDLNRLRYHKLNPKASRILRNGIIRIILIFKESHPDIKYEIFMRLNKGAITLSEQELRNCLYRGTFNQLLHKLREHPSVLKLMRRKEKHKRMTDAELLLRHFMVSEGYSPSIKSVEGYTGNMRSSLNGFMRKKQNAGPQEIARMESECIATIETCLDVFGDDALQRVDEDGNFDGRLNRALMDSVLACFKLHDEADLKANKDGIKSGLIELFNDPKFLDAITVRTSDKKKMDYRVSKFCSMVDEVLAAP
ncbi:DUF262 domain-containing protein [Crateriforma conspicua]|uniref:DUF262 domain-containing protein n=1 Tax=Crateriforma conspicua TaxID=2527996 RepID=UPI001188010C|nr:DUF262 domain-containing protein [Crateriforma conspicua]QDV62759.1 hypothetical protein Mal65_18950 [Crateriforma conspicua]